MEGDLESVARRPGFILHGRLARNAVSAKRAVDGDLVQGALENRELLIIEARQEILRDPAGVGRHALGQPCDAGIGEGNHDAPSVGAGVRSTNEAFID